MLSTKKKLYIGVLMLKNLYRSSCSDNQKWL